MLMTHNTLSIHKDLLASKYQPETSTIMEFQVTGQRVCMLCLSEQKAPWMVQHCASESCGPHYVHVSCWKDKFCKNSMDIYATYAWLRNTGNKTIPKLEGPRCRMETAKLLMVNVVDDDCVTQRRFEAPLSNPYVSTWIEVFARIKEVVQFVNDVIQCANLFTESDVQTIPVVTIEDYLPAAFPREGLDPKLFSL